MTTVSNSGLAPYFPSRSRLAEFELIATLCLGACVVAMTALVANEHSVGPWSKPTLSSAERSAARACLKGLPRDWVFRDPRFAAAPQQMRAISESASHLEAALSADAGERLTYLQRQQVDSELAGWNCHSSWSLFVPFDILMPIGETENEYYRGQIRRHS